MNDELLDYATIGEYKGKPVFLFKNSGQFWIAFGTPESYQYWITALERIILTRPGYSFKTPEGLEVSVDEIQPLLAKTQGILEYL